MYQKSATPQQADDLLPAITIIPFAKDYDTIVFIDRICSNQPIKLHFIKQKLTSDDVKVQGNVTKERLS